MAEKQEYCRRLGRNITSADCIKAVGDYCNIDNNLCSKLGIRMKLRSEHAQRQAKGTKFEYNPAIQYPSWAHPADTTD